MVQTPLHSPKKRVWDSAMWNAVGNTHFAIDLLSTWWATLSTLYIYIVLACATTSDALPAFEPESRLISCLMCLVHVLHSSAMIEYIAKLAATLCCQFVTAKLYVQKSFGGVGPTSHQTIYKEEIFDGKSMKTVLDILDKAFNMFR